LLPPAARRYAAACYERVVERLRRAFTAPNTEFAGFSATLYTAMPRCAAFDAVAAYADSHAGYMMPLIDAFFQRCRTHTMPLLFAMPPLRQPALCATLIMPRFITRCFEPHACRPTLDFLLREDEEHTRR